MPPADHHHTSLHFPWFFAILGLVETRPGSSADRTPPCGGGGQRFKSSPGYHPRPVYGRAFLLSFPMTTLLALPPDQFLTCQHCRITFVWTGWEQQHDKAPPAHCPGCRHLLRLTAHWGVVKWFDARKGFGFITAADGREIYVRRRDVVRGKLRRGQWVRFRLAQGSRGPRAIHVEGFRQLPGHPS